MAYLTRTQLEKMGFKSLGNNVSISHKASIYNCAQIALGDNTRVDDFCVLSGKLDIGRNVHITPMCLLAGGTLGVVIEDFVTLAYGVKAFTQSDDYSGSTMTNSTIPKSYKNEFKSSITMRRHSIVGAGSIIMPGVELAEGTSVGANSLVLHPTEPWTIVAGSPVIKLKDRKQNLLILEKQYLAESEKKSPRTSRRGSEP